MPAKIIIGIFMSLLAALGGAARLPIQTDTEDAFVLRLMSIKPNPETDRVHVRYKLEKKNSVGKYSARGLGFEYVVKYCKADVTDQCTRGIFEQFEDNGKASQWFTVVIEPELLEDGAYDADPQFGTFYYDYEICTNAGYCEPRRKPSVASLPRKLLIDGHEHRGINLLKQPR